ncbi:type II toxin-antitoxin system Phd/YefM family antitoxin [Pseudoleptotrichia goodfellowii]|jgi:prevent-host-death family protein|uniref:Antitoxin n=2 Tax=Pseudoleptotrichia goodfellowii TaxID=157692 RepID=D0GJ07_9FUSO|nr:type II toxin-antitoxin system prevent-host-death family antitoxin [Pseudoleptotrichia goodfellowii]EEY35942.1 prevent-host-death family protein [Pseudoleptotrichia goodfellowii F0264]MBF4805790.1 type II toxin-antitoxin system prevent-host-death family antitoxin [Pseudoleptotrichia goodfellowii]BBM36672.1 prevent-host-death family protein [Pseudoleptotrichia goodfellowii]
MIAVNYSSARNNFKDYCDKATDDFETIIITRKENKNVVLMSEDEYNNLMENLYIMSNKKYYNELLKRKAEVEAGLVEEHDIIEVE